jgi:hypothetical protein
MTQQASSGDLTIEVTVDEGRTTSQYHMGRNGSLTFRNDSGDPLVVTATAGRPFREHGCSEPQAEITVPPGSEKTVRIADDFNGTRFAYTARIGDTEPEDPIVIIDRH